MKWLRLVQKWVLHIQGGCNNTKWSDCILHDELLVCVCLQCAINTTSMLNSIMGPVVKFVWVVLVESGKDTLEAG